MPAGFGGFAVVLAATCRLLSGCALACMCLAGRIGFLWAFFPTTYFAFGVSCCASSVLSMFGVGFIVLSQARCFAGFVGVLSSLPPDGRIVRVSGVLGRGWLFGLDFDCAGCGGLGRTVRVPGLPLSAGVLC